MVRQGAVDNFLDCLQIIRLPRPGATRRQRDHQRIHITHQRIQIVGVAHQLWLQAQFNAFDAAHSRRFDPIRCGFTAGDLPAPRQ
ncbi:hypothetical protein D3C76_1232910 [compost metagenome]